jgi:hypothetical protein
MHCGERTIAACTFASASETHERAVEIREPSCVPRAAKHFFIPVVHSLSGAVVRGSIGAPLSERQNPEPYDT